MLYFFIGFFSGCVIFGGAVWVLNRYRTTDYNAMKHVFNELSQSTLEHTQQQFFNLANERFNLQTKQHADGLDHKKLIDQTLSNVKKEFKMLKQGFKPSNPIIKNDLVKWRDTLINIVKPRK